MTPEQKIALIRKSLERGGTHEWEDFLPGLRTGAFQLFDNDHGVCLTEILKSPRKKHLHCWVTAGELPGVMDLSSRVEQHALDHGCDFMTTIGRFGWEAILPKYGWKKTDMVFTKELTHG